MANSRFELRFGKFGAYFHDNNYNFDMPLELVLERLNRTDDYAKRLSVGPTMPEIPDKDTIESGKELIYYEIRELLNKQQDR